jgi:signal transduction histidine kinase
MAMVRGGVRHTVVWAAMLAACVLGTIAKAQSDNRPTRVLVINSTRQNQQFFMVSERELPKLLSDGVGRPVDYYTEYLDVHRFSHTDFEAVYVDFLRRKYEGRRFDLILLMGNPAMDFMARHRQALFRGTPVVFYTLSQPGSDIENATGLINTLRFGPSIDLALALQPDLEQVYVVSGAAASDRDYERQARAEFRRFDGRLEFAYLSGLATTDLEERLRRLPARSAVYYAVASEDGEGASVQQMAYLARVAAAANAPTYSWADLSVDAGIVGGRRRDQVAQMKAIATLAVRVLRGERPDDIRVASPKTDVDAVDWRQLRRWGLDESRLPAGTRVLFRAPGMWDQYWRYIIGAAVLILAQTALIGGLLLQRARRQRVERALRGSQVRLRLSYDRIRSLSRRLLGEQEAERARIARELHDDVNQQLTLLALELDRIRARELPADGERRLAHALQTAHDVATSVRELSHRLHPSRLQLIGLVAGLDSLRRDVSPPHLPIAFSHRNVPREIDPEVALCLFRVAQEALANAVKHSQAGHIRIELAGGPSGLGMRINDDGKGFDIERMSDGGLGLTSMRERVEAIGGVMEIRTAPGAGTHLRITVPIHSPEVVMDAVPSA